MTTTNLTPAQHAILAYARENAAGRITWFPDHIKGGARAKVLEGTVEMAMNYSLTDDEVAEGYVLTCQAMPRSERVVVSYDA